MTLALILPFFGDDRDERRQGRSARIGGDGMGILSLIIAVIALVIAVVAFMRTGGGREVQRQMQALSPATDSVRDRAADALNRLERLIRGQEKTKPDAPACPPSAGD